MSESDSWRRTAGARLRGSRNGSDQINGHGRARRQRAGLAQADNEAVINDHVLDELGLDDPQYLHSLEVGLVLGVAAE